MLCLTDPQKNEQTSTPPTNTSTMTPYTDYLIRVASLRADKAVEPPAAADPVIFVREILQDLDTSIHTGTATTRLGIEHMMDKLFANPALAALLDDPHNSQNAVAHALPQKTSLFQMYWTHIICPAWNHYADVRRVCLSSASIG